MKDVTTPVTGRPFQPGESGNPRGRPKGSLNKKTLAFQQICDEKSEAVWLTIADKAIEGDPTAMKIFADRTLPVRREPAVSLDVPEPKTKAEIVQISQAIVSAALGGELPTSQAFALFKLLDLHWRVLENSAPTLSGDTAAPDSNADLIPIEPFAKGLKQFGDEVGLRSAALSEASAPELGSNSIN